MGASSLMGGFEKKIMGWETPLPHAPPLWEALMNIRPNTQIFWRAYIARLISTWRKVCLYTIYCTLIWFNYIRSIKTKKCFWFVYKFKIKLVIICNYSLFIWLPWNGRQVGFNYLYFVYLICMFWYLFI